MNLSRLFLPLVFSLLATASLAAQSATFSLPVVSGCAGETVCMPITVDDFSDVVEFGFSLRWDPECLIFENVINRNTTVDGESLMDINTALSGLGSMTAFWQQWDADAGETCEDLPTGLTIADDEILFEICFTVDGPFGTSCDVCPFNAPQPLTVRKKQGNGDCTDDAILGFTCGVASVCVDPLEMSLEVPFGAFQPGDLMCIDLIMDDGFINVDGLQLGLNWDCSVLQVNSVIPNTDIPNNIAGFYNIDDPCEFFLAWQSLPNQPVTLDPNTVFAQVCFDIVGECGDDTPVAISPGPQGQPVEATNNNLQLLPTVLTDDFADIDNCNPAGLDVIFNCPPPAELGDIVCVEVQAGDNFENITTMEYLVKWNPNILEYVNTQNYGPLGMNASDFDPNQEVGVLAVEYSISFPQDLDPGDVVYEICFEVVGVEAGSFVIGSSPTNIQTSPDGDIIGIDPQNCVIDVIQPESVVLDLGSADISSNEPVCIPVEVTGFDNIGSIGFSLQFDNGLFDYINFDNLAIPGAIVDDGLAAAAGIISFTYDGPGTTLPNGSVLFELCLQAAADAEPSTCAPFDLISIPNPPEAFTEANPGVNIGIIAIPGEHCVLFPEGFGIILEDASQGIDSNFCTPVRVISYDNILEADFNLNFDPTLLEFVEINTITSPPAFTVSDGGPGVLNFTTNSGTPVNIPDSTVIFEVCFNTLLTVDCAPFFGTTNSEPSSTTTNGDGSILFNDAEICVEDRLIINSVTVIPTSCEDECDGQIAFDISGGNGQIFVRDQSRPFVTYSDDTIRSVCAGWIVYDIFNNGDPSVSVTDSVFVPVDPTDQPTANLGDQDTVALGCGNTGVIIGGSGNCGSSYQLFRLGDNGSSVFIEGDDIDGSCNVLIIVNTDGTYVLEVRNELGCLATDTVFVTPPVFPIAEAGPTDTTLTCDNEPLILSGEGSSEDGFFSYMWVRFIAGVPVDTVSETQAAVIDSAGDYVLVVTNAQTLCSSSDEISVGDDRDPPNIGVPTQTSLGCNGEAAELNTGLFGNNFVHQWLDENGVPDGTSPEYTADLPGTYNVTVLNTDNGCESTAEIVVAAGGGNPIINQPIEMTTLYCSSDSTPILVTYDNISPAANYDWSTMDGDLATGQSSVANPIVLATGTYTVIVNDNGCISSTEVVVGESLLPQVEAGDDIPLDCQDPTLIDASSGTDSGPNFSYQWFFEGDSIVGATDIQTFANNGLGSYSILVTNDITGCTAQDDVSVIGSLEVPSVVLPDTAGTLTCEEDSLIIAPIVGPIGPNYTYLWSSTGPGEPIGDGSTFVATGSGLYGVTVTNEGSGCSTIAATTVLAAFDDPPFVALTRDTIGITCDQPIRILDGSLSQDGDNITYEWDNVEGGEEPNMQGNDTLQVGTAGTYTFTVTDTETQCSATDTIYVVDTRVFPMVDTLPTNLLNCDNQSTTLGLNLLVGDTSNFTVIWSPPAVCSGVELGNSFMEEVECGGTYGYTVINNVSGCFSGGTIRVETDIDTAASIEFVEPDVFDCTSTSLTLEATYSGMDAPDMINWESLDGNTITPPNGSLIVSVDGPGFYVVTIESTTACEVTDTLEVLADQNTPVADAGMDFEVLCNEPVTLDGSNSSQGPDFSYLWTAINGGIAMGEDPTQQMVLANGPGTYVLEVTNETNLCADSDTLQVTSAETPASAGPDQFICGDSTCVSATPPTGFVGTWTALELNGATFDPNADVNTACVTGITQPVTLVWTISLASGGSPECDDSDTMMIMPATAPEAIDDNLLVNNADGTGTIDLALNDNTTGPFTITLLNEPEFGSFTSNINGRLSYQAPMGISGTFTVDYEICASDCDGLCDQGTLTVRVEAEGTEPQVYNAITPNEDGLNDRFVFEVLEFGDPADFPDNEFILFNRWGDILYEAKPYLNDFNGTLPNGKVLAEGTYYYILRLNLGEGLIFRGDLTIVR